MLNFKKITLIFLLAAFLFSLSSAVVFSQGRKLEIVYPEIKEFRPEYVTTPLPQYIIYIFNFAIWLAGLVAFGALIYGGFRYLTSAGSPAVMSDAQGQMLAGILGLILILSSYLILTNINPQLVLLKAPGLVATYGVYLSPANNAAGEVKVTKSIPDLEDYFGAEYPKGGFKQLDFFTMIIGKEEWQEEKWPDGKMGGVEAILYEGINYTLRDYNCKMNTNFSVSNVGFVPKSIILIFKMPGAILCDKKIEKTTAGGEEYLYCPGESRLFPASSATLGDFNDRTQGIFFYTLPGSDVEYGAVLHEHANFEGQSKIFLTPSDPADDKPIVVGNGVSSITLFFTNAGVSGGGVTLCRNMDCQREKVKVDDKEVEKEASRLFSFTNPLEDCDGEQCQYPSDFMPGMAGEEPGIYLFGDDGYTSKWRRVTSDTPNLEKPCPPADLCSCEQDTCPCGLHDNASSLRISGPYDVRLFWDVDYKAKTICFNSSVSSLGQYGWNDKVSALKILEGGSCQNPGETVSVDYYEENIKNTEVAATVSETAKTEFAQFDKIIRGFPDLEQFKWEEFDENIDDCGGLTCQAGVSAIRIDPGYMAILYEHDCYNGDWTGSGCNVVFNAEGDQPGRSEVFTSNDGNLRNNHIGNDAVSSMIIIKIK